MTPPKDETSGKAESAAYDVGYGKPPKHTQFRKGKSGNPGGRPAKPSRASALALEEAYRTYDLEDDNGAELKLSAIQAIMRDQIELALRGNIDAQRFVFATIQKIERES